jgi:hypothetical protein
MAGKQYSDASAYERKLEKVMNRFGVEDYNYNFDRFSAWVEFRYKGQLYRFEHSKDKATAHGINLIYGSDCFAQIVLSLEDLARMSERGIYELQTWLEGMRFLPPPSSIPECFRLLGFTEIPGSVDAVNSRFKELAKVYHADKGGSSNEFVTLQAATEQAIEIMKGTEDER